MQWSVFQFHLSIYYLSIYLQSSIYLSIYLSIYEVIYWNLLESPDNKTRRNKIKITSPGGTVTSWEWERAWGYFQVLIHSSLTHFQRFVFWDPHRPETCDPPASSPECWDFKHLQSWMTPTLVFLFFFFKMGVYLPRLDSNT
jgi:hypothetical protein